MNKIVLDSITVENQLVKYQFHTNKALASYFKTQTMFLQYEEDMTDVPVSILTIPFVNVMAGLSWLSDAMLFVDEIDKTYYEAFKKIKVAYSELHRTQFKGVFVPSLIVENHFHKLKNESLLLFGGGVDCHTSFLRNRNTVSNIVNIYGWLNNVDERNKVDESDSTSTKEYATKMGVAAQHVRSNFASLFDLSVVDKDLCNPIIKTSYWYGLLHPMAFLAITAPLAWKYQIPTLVIASSFTKDRANVHCASFITTDSEFRFAEQGHTLHDGFEMNRQDKVKYLADYQRSTNKPYKLQSCSFNDHNCCTCEKCFRTMVELIAEDANPRDFGFNNMKGSLKEHWSNIVDRDVALWGIAKESYYYGYSAKRMRENYSMFSGERKDFVDWFLNFDFAKAKREGLKKYYKKNFFKILKRKLHP